MQSPEQPDLHPLLVFFRKELKRRRTEKNLSQGAVASFTGYSTDYISKVELGYRKPTPKLAKLLDARFPEAGGMFSRLADEAGLADGDWFESWIEVEAKAASLRTFEGQVIPGLIQKPDYARAIYAPRRAIEANIDLDAHVESRIKRQKIFESDAPPSFGCIIDEQVLYRCIGSPKIMREQLEHTLEISEHPRITVQVLPLDVGAHVGLQGAFVLATFADDTPAMVYLESQEQASITSVTDTVARMAATYEALGVETPGSRQSRDLIQKAIKEKWMI